MIPAPESAVDSPTADWSGSWFEDYETPQELLEEAREASVIKTARSSRGMVWNKHMTADPLGDDDAFSMTTQDEARRERLTKTLAWLHSRGEIRMARAQTHLTIRHRCARQLQHRRRRWRGRLPSPKLMAVSSIRWSAIQRVLRREADSRPIHVSHSRHTRRHRFAHQDFQRKTRSLARRYPPGGSGSTRLALAMARR